MPIETFVLSNGLRIVCEPMPSARSVAVGIYVGTGSRDETTPERGISHFIEHILFKGTARRDAVDIVREIEGRGGCINAETDKEYTAFYVRVLPEDLSGALDVLSDMLLAPRLAPQDIERERRVVLEELRELMDYPEDYVHDLFAQTLWKRHPLAHPVIGEERTIRSFTREQILQVLQARYTASGTVIAAAGQINPAELAALVEHFFHQMPTAPSQPRLRKAHAHISQRFLPHPTKQVHFCMGTAGVNLYDERKYTVAVLDTLLGGNMSSRLFQEVREKRGLVYHISTSATAYREGGSFAVHANCSPENYHRVIEVVRSQMQEVCEGNLTEEEVERSKHQLRGGLLMSTESVYGHMSSNAKSMLFHGRVITLDEMIERIQQVDAQQVVQVARDLLGEGEMTIAAIGSLGEGGNGQDEHP